MRAPDVNILVYAHRHDEPAHGFYHAWLRELVESGAPFGLSGLVAVAFVRIVTHPRFHDDPTPLTTACEVIDKLAEAPGCRWLAPRERHWMLTRKLCLETGSTGKRVADAQHAALSIEHGCRWVTRDDDFAVFQKHGLEWEHLVP